MKSPDSILRKRFSILSGSNFYPSDIASIMLLSSLISVAELALFYDLLNISIWLHFATLLVCLCLPLKFTRSTDIYKAFALLPVFRLVNLGMPIFFNTTILLLPVVYAPLIPACVLIGQDLNVSITKRWQYGLLLGPLAFPMSAVMAAIEFSIITPRAFISTDTTLQIVLVALIMLLFVGFVEEFLYRAILQRTLTQHIGFVPALLVASTLFGLMHSAHGQPLELVFAGSIGLVYGIIYRYTDSLLYITILHGLLNTFLFGVYPLNNAVFGLPLGARSVALLP